MSRGGREGWVARVLASALLSAPWERDALIAVARATVRPAPRWLAAVVDEVLRLHPRPPHDAPRELGRLLVVLTARRSPALRALQVVGVSLPVSRMGRRRWPVAELDDVGALGALLGLDAARLAWLADAKGLDRRGPDRRLRGYHHLVVHRPSGLARVLEAPKPMLKAAQRTVLGEVLRPIEPHPAAHGFVGGRSAVTHAALHTGQATVLRFDLEDCFASVAAGRVFGLLRLAGYPEAVAHALTALCTSVVPEAVWARVGRPHDPALLGAHHRLGRRLATPHLPQGAPTSPALVNLVLFTLDRRMAGLAARLDARYSRYADDLVLSGGPHLRRRAGRIEGLVGELARDEGFAVRAAKTRVMGAAGRQVVGGVVVNAHTAAPREEVDRLRAVVHRAVLDGPDPSLSRDRLLGQIGWVAQRHPARGARLRAAAEAIVWPG